MKKLTRQELVEKVESSKGRILTVSFVKKDGSLRNLNGRLGVTTHLRGGNSTVDKDRFITIYDLKNDGYRVVNRETIYSVKIDHEEFVCDEN